YTRYFTVVLAFIQAIGMSVALRQAFVKPTIEQYLIVALTLTAGTTLLMWIGEQITEKGIGNGISLLIFAGIVSRVPAGFYQVTEYFQPEITSKKPKIIPLAIKSLKTFISIPGTGICAPIRKTNNMAKVKSIFFLNSSTFTAVRRLFNI
ncbi:hypothetical protein HX99_02385, partial [Peptococcaceae bacterium SCADC1_2_3]